MPAVSALSDLLRELRERELRRMAPNARTVVHGRAADAPYLRWFDEHYPGSVERHLGAGDVASLQDASVDLVFCDEAIERLAPLDAASLLLDSHRVLRPGGRLVIDAPNRRVTEGAHWRDSERTFALAVDEAVELVSLAGFDVQDVRGVLLGYDASAHRYLPVDELEDGAVAWEERARAGLRRPEDAVVWWLEATRGPRDPQVAVLQERFAAYAAGSQSGADAPRPVLAEASIRQLAGALARRTVAASGRRARRLIRSR